MTKRTKFLQWFLPMAVLYTAGFILSANLDLKINQTVYHPSGFFVLFMEVFGWLPAFIPALLYAMLWVSGSTQFRPPAVQRLAGWLVLVGGTPILFMQAYGYLAKRGLLEQGFLWKVGLGAAVFLLLIAFGLKKVWKLPEPLYGKLRHFAFFGTVYMMGNQIVIYTFKTIWQRTRFDDMVAAGSFDAFTPWYMPFGNGGNSMPSGHTANAAGILVLIILCDLFPAWNKKRKLVYALCWGYIIAMGLARIVIGRHFLSDTLAASGIMAILFYILRNSPQYKNALQEIRSGLGRKFAPR